MHPSVLDWEQYLAKDGPSGGCSAFKIDLDDLRAQEYLPIEAVRGETNGSKKQSGVYAAAKCAKVFLLTTTLLKYCGY